jgi:hypothetical protein
VFVDFDTFADHCHSTGGCWSHCACKILQVIFTAWQDCLHSSCSRD